MSPVDPSESLQGPDPPFPVRRTGTSTGALGQDLRCDCAFICFPCGSPDGPSIAPRTLKAANQYPSSHLRVAFEAVPLSGKVTSRRPSHQVGTRSCEATSEALPGECQ
jgi:hypothetical protein